MNPKISVIIPVYNGELFIERTIRSVLAQEVPVHEIIVMDDGSTDKTPVILEKFKGRILVKRTANQGAASARNQGVSWATGDYIAFLDADDVWFRHCTKKYSEFIVKYPEIGFFCANYIVRFNELGRRLVRHYSVIPERSRLNFNEPLKRNTFQLLLNGNFVGTPSATIIKIQVAKEAGLFDLSYDIVEDLGFFMQVSLLTNFLLIGDVLLYKRLHDNNASSKKIEMYTNQKRLLKQMMVSKKPYILSHKLSDDCARSLAQLNYWMGTLHFEAGDKKKAFSFYLQGLQSIWSISNILKFLRECFKKVARMLTFDRLSRKNLGIDAKKRRF